MVLNSYHSVPLELGDGEYLKIPYNVVVCRINFAVLCQNYDSFLKLLFSYILLDIFLKGDSALSALSFTFGLSNFGLSF